MSDRQIPGARRPPPLKLGMVGGGCDAFIGEVHRIAARLDGLYQLTAGCLSSTPDRALASAAAVGLPEQRSYATWEEMLQHEQALPVGERIDLVAVVTPNHLHFPVARAFVDAGFHVVCDKPMVHTSDQAIELVQLVEARGTVFAVTYNYTGYPMVREAREIIRAGRLGSLRKVIVEFNQDWLAAKLEERGVKQAEWRTDPVRAGIAGAIGDIGSHAENLVATVTGLRLEAVCADVTTFVPGRALDDDANMLLRYEGGVRGVLIASQISVGSENALRLRVYGEKGGLEWHQEHPNQLSFTAIGEPERVLTRGNSYLSASAQRAQRIPPGHPEAFLEAFANLYREIARDVRTRSSGAGGAASPVDPAPDYPTVYDGARGVRFIEQAVASGASTRKWTELAPPGPA